MNALGVAVEGSLGTECAGMVTRVGAAVQTVRVGDRVMAVAQGAFSRFVTVDARMAARVPDGLALEQAATVPAVFLTAWYALHDLAKLKRGERILVHSAAGGVGMAAIQLAHWIGAEVLATASPSKWDAVRSLGVKHVANSRDVSFVPPFRAAGGADVVLNSLTGEFIDASLSLLSSGGRFIEMGRTDVRDAATLAAAHPGVTYQVFDLLKVDPDRMAAMFAAVAGGFASGHLKALPVRTFPMTAAEGAFRFMAQARHVGKIALTAPRASLRVDGTALVTGGLGALGLQVARNFARRGMKHLVLTGRRGLATPGAPEAVSELEALGARVTVAPVDVADRAALERVIRAIPAALPLRAVVHSALVLDDGMLAEQTPERFRKVMSPKVLGAWNLHALTERADLDVFVLFSSMVGTLGNAAQGAYSAANACLDALAVHRQALGLPAVSLGWGPWAEAGGAAALSAQLQARLTGQGFAMIAPSQGMALFDKALTRHGAQLVVVLDLRAAAKSLGAVVPPVWRALIRAPIARPAAAGGSWASEFAALPAEGRLEAMTQAVRAEVARVLSLGRAAAVPVDRPLRELGLDSLMAVELRNALGRRVGATLPANLAFDHPTPAAIAKFLLSEVPSLAGKAGPVETTDPRSNGHEKAAPAPLPPGPARALSLPAPAVPVAELARPADQIDTIPMGERWLADGFRVIPTAGGFAQRMVDMTHATEALRALGEVGLHGTFTHVVVRAAALALARNPRLHESVIGYRKLTPGAVDIGLSMAGQTTYAPVVVLPAVDRTSLRALVDVVGAATAAARLKEAHDLQNLRRVGWVTPFGFFRRFVIRMLQRSFWFRRRIVGTFQVTSVPTADLAVPLQFYAGSILSFGRVHSSVVAVGGAVEVRPMLSLTICVEHVTTDAMRAGALLSEIASILESEELVDEARGAASDRVPVIGATKSASRQPAALPPASAE
jgi:NADPH:quinone reductase-like Zn-dependent oxidoreductase/pyruvate/2-oxoglutarate dehydrogenase complex dihydrolipoamide acyltransferase (E2) component